MLARFGVPKDAVRIDDEGTGSSSAAAADTAPRRSSPRGADGVADGDNSGSDGDERDACGGVEAALQTKTGMLMCAHTILVDHRLPAAAAVAALSRDASAAAASSPAAVPIEVVDEADEDGTTAASASSGADCDGGDDGVVHHPHPEATSVADLLRRTGVRTGSAVKPPPGYDAGKRSARGLEGGEAVLVALGFENGGCYVIDAGLQLVQVDGDAIGGRSGGVHALKTARKPRVVASLRCAREPLLSLAMNAPCTVGVVGTAGDALVTFGVDLARGDGWPLRRIPLPTPGSSCAACVPYGPMPDECEVDPRNPARFSMMVTGCWDTSVRLLVVDDAPPVASASALYCDADDDEACGDPLSLRWHAAGVYAVAAAATWANGEAGGVSAVGMPLVHVASADKTGVVAVWRVEGQW